MKCDFYEERIMEYLDGELNPQAKLDLEEHLKNCAHCTKFLLDIQKQYLMLSEMPLLSPTQGFTRKVMAEIRREKIAGRIPWIAFIPAVILVAEIIYMLEPRRLENLIPAFTGAVSWLVMVVKSVDGMLGILLWMANFAAGLFVDLQSILVFPAEIMADIIEKNPWRAVTTLAVFIAEILFWVRLLAPRKGYR